MVMRLTVIRQLITARLYTPTCKEVATPQQLSWLTWPPPSNLGVARPPPKSSRGGVTPSTVKRSNTSHCSLGGVEIFFQLFFIFFFLLFLCSFIYGICDIVIWLFNTRDTILLVSHGEYANWHFYKLDWSTKRWRLRLLMKSLLLIKN